MKKCLTALLIVIGALSISTFAPVLVQSATGVANQQTKVKSDVDKNIAVETPKADAKARAEAEEKAKEQARVKNRPTTKRSRGAKTLAVAQPTIRGRT